MATIVLVPLAVGDRPDAVRVAEREARAARPAARRRRPAPPWAGRAEAPRQPTVRVHRYANEAEARRRSRIARSTARSSQRRMGQGAELGAASPWSPSCSVMPRVRRARRSRTSCRRSTARRCRRRCCRSCSPVSSRAPPPRCSRRALRARGLLVAARRSRPRGGRHRQSWLDVVAGAGRQRRRVGLTVLAIGATIIGLKALIGGAASSSPRWRWCSSATRSRQPGRRQSCCPSRSAGSGSCCRREPDRTSSGAPGTSTAPPPECRWRSCSPGRSAFSRSSPSQRCGAAAGAAPAGVGA